MSDNPFFLRVAATADRFSMLPPGRVTVCLSGGADSVALLRVLLELRERYALTVTAVHVHHGIRGDEASRDERFCRALCERLGVPLTVRRADVPALARASGDSLELAARKARYAAFEALQAQCGGVFATAHTLNDNAETVVHAFLRSRAPSSLCGIPPVRGFFVRPLLERTRAEVEDYLASLGQPFVTDATNADERYTRNFIRHTLLPLMQRLAYASGVTLGDAFDMPGAVTMVTRNAKLYIPMDELVDKAAERARLTKERESVVKQLTQCDAKLGNETFLSKAPAQVVEGVRTNAESLRKKLALIDESLAALG